MDDYVSMKIGIIILNAINLMALISGSWEWFTILGIGFAFSPIIALIVVFLADKKCGKEEVKE